MQKNDREYRKYLKSIKKSLVCENRVKKKLLNDIENNILDYAESYPDKSFDEIIEHFGSPQTIAKEVFLEYDNNYSKKIKYGNMTKVIVIAILFVIALAIVILASVIVKNNKRTAVYYYDVSVSDYGIDSTAGEK